MILGRIRSLLLLMPYCLNFLVFLLEVQSNNSMAIVMDLKMAYGATMLLKSNSHRRIRSTRHSVLHLAVDLGNDARHDPKASSSAEEAGMWHGKLQCG